MVEVAGRVLRLQNNSPNFLRLDPAVGWRLQPGFEGFTRDEHPVAIQINQAGWRDREHAIGKPPHTFRIAVLGDSFAQGLGVEFSQTFTSVLERRMGECDAMAGNRPEVLNFGVQGYGPAQEFLVLQQYALAYQPDLILQMFFVGNDVGDSSRRLHEGNAERPYFIYSGSDLRLDNSFRDGGKFSPVRLKLRNMWRYLRSKSVILDAGESFYRRYSTRAVDARLTGFEMDRRKGDPSYSNRILLPPQDDDEREAWRIVEGVLKQTSLEAHRHGAGYWLAMIPGEIQVNPHLEIRQAFLQRLGAERFDYPNRRLAEFTTANGIPFIDLTAPMKEVAETRQSYLYGFDGSGFGHWNADGHSAAAGIVAGRLCGALREEGGVKP